MANGMDRWTDGRMDSGRHWVVENETVKCFYYIFPPSGCWVLVLVLFEFMPSLDPNKLACTLWASPCLPIPSMLHAPCPPIPDFSDFFRAAAADEFHYVRTNHHMPLGCGGKIWEGGWKNEGLRGWAADCTASSSFKSNFVHLLRTRDSMCARSASVRKVNTISLRTKTISIWAYLWECGHAVVALKKEMR